MDELREGEPVTLVGTVRLADGEGLAAPVSGRRCAGFAVTGEWRRRHMPAAPLRSQNLAGAKVHDARLGGFFLDDGAQRVWVDAVDEEPGEGRFTLALVPDVGASRALFSPAAMELAGEQAATLAEAALVDGRRVAVTGVARYRQGVRAGVATRGGSYREPARHLALGPPRHGWLHVVDAAEGTVEKRTPPLQLAWMVSLLLGPLVGLAASETAWPWSWREHLLARIVLGAAIPIVLGAASAIGRRGERVPPAIAALLSLLAAASTISPIRDLRDGPTVRDVVVARSENDCDDQGCVMRVELTDGTQVATAALDEPPPLGPARQAQLRHCGVDLGLLGYGSPAHLGKPIVVLWGLFLPCAVALALVRRRARHLARAQAAASEWLGVRLREPLLAYVTVEVSVGEDATSYAIRGPCGWSRHEVSVDADGARTLALDHAVLAASAGDPSVRGHEEADFAAEMQRRGYVRVEHLAPGEVVHFASPPPRGAQLYRRDLPRHLEIHGRRDGDRLAGAPSRPLLVVDPRQHDRASAAADGGSIASPGALLWIPTVLLGLVAAVVSLIALALR